MDLPFCLGVLGDFSGAGALKKTGRGAPADPWPLASARVVSKTTPAPKSIEKMESESGNRAEYRTVMSDSLLQVLKFHD